MASHTVSKDDLETTLHNVNVLLYAVEEVLIHASQPLPAMDDVKKGLEELRTQLDKAPLPSAITYEAPEPARTLLAGDPTQRLRKNVCTP
jgi:hypothetical protein